MMLSVLVDFIEPSAGFTRINGSLSAKHDISFI
jgi:hypothetical protein